MQRNRPFLLTGLALSLLLTPLPATSQRQDPGVFGEVIDVRVVNLEVVVTDRKGNRITGLKPADFVLTVDGDEVPVEYFTEIYGGKAVEREADSQVSSVPQLAPGEAVSTSYLVFVDDYFSRTQERDRVLQAMISQLPNLQPEDRMAVVAYDGKGIDMLSSWSRSPEELAATLNAAQSRPSGGLQWEALLRSYEADIRTGSDFTFQGQSAITELTTAEERAVQDINHQVERVVLAASSALRSFANPPGRKVMLLLSGGWPWDTVQFVTRHRIRTSLDSPYDTGSDLYAPLIETANRLSYTLYAVDTPGMRAGSSASGSAFFAGEDIAARNDILDRQFEFDAALLNLARGTGGRAFLNGKENDALAEVANDTRSYYWLGFTPTWKGNDESHDVRIRMRDKSLEVRSRSSFSDLSREAEVTMMVESALLFGNPPSTEPLIARVGRATKAGAGRVTLPLSVIIPMSSLTFLPHAEGYVANTELRVAVLDENGNTAEVPVIELPLVLERPPKEGELRRFDTEVKLRKRQHDVVVSLYDTASGKILSARLEVDPG